MQKISVLYILYDHLSSLDNIINKFFHSVQIFSAPKFFLNQSKNKDILSVLAKFFKEICSCIPLLRSLSMYKDYTFAFTKNHL